MMDIVSNYDALRTSGMILLGLALAIFLLISDNKRCQQAGMALAILVVLAAIMVK